MWKSNITVYEKEDKFINNYKYYRPINLFLKPFKNIILSYT